MHYELWDMVSRNLLDDFETEAEALAAIGALLAINEPDMADGLALIRVGGQGGGAIVARDVELAARAQATTPELGQRPA
jgi:hypothetical protein